MVDHGAIKEIMWESAKEAFETMIFASIKRIDDEPVEQSSQSLICTITFNGRIQGAFSVICSDSGVEKMTRSMLMMEPDDPVSETDTCDAYGEVTNLLVGGFKTRISDIVPDISISIPSVVRGQKVRPGGGRGMERVDLNTDFDGEPIKMALVYRTPN